jgi:hypothetical protein
LHSTHTINVFDLFICQYDSLVSDGADSSALIDVKLNLTSDAQLVSLVGDDLLQRLRAAFNTSLSDPSTPATSTPTPKAATLTRTQQWDEIVIRRVQPRRAAGGEGDQGQWINFHSDFNTRTLQVCHLNVHSLIIDQLRHAFTRLCI